MLTRNFQREGLMSKGSKHKWYSERTVFFTINVFEVDDNKYSWSVVSNDVTFDSARKYDTVEHAYFAVVDFVETKMRNIKLGEIE